ncbi:Na+/H+ antiporter NhaC family protein [Intestinibacter sp.]|uniref:Na+/H+ antiporter NhaC family protein n=1 Tax=Intestinibacter sp. TaxID=1965304 RepID=UPI003F15B011
MDIVVGLCITFISLLFCVFKGIFVGYPLLFGFCIFLYISCKRGFAIKDLMKMAFDEGKQSFIVLEIFVLIGMITSVWMASGTVPSIIYYALKYINLNYFVVYAFIITCIVAFLLGTSLGTVSTIGIALILIAKSGGMNVNLVAGAILSGAYFGDRCSPVSSSAFLVANLTKTDIYTNISNMFKTSVVPFIITVVLYYIFSINSSNDFAQITLDKEIVSSFKVGIVILIPAIIILLFAAFKVNVMISMSISIVAAVVIAIIFQGYSPMEVLNLLVFGFEMDLSNSLHSILKGGGILSMWQAAFVVFLSCSLSGIFTGTNMLKSVEDLMMKARGRFSLFIHTIIVSFLTAAFGCNQSISSVLTYNLLHKSYEANGMDNYKLAIDLENTGITLAATIPWNLSVFVPALTMDVSNVGLIPYAFYLFLIPLVNLLLIKILPNGKYEKYHRMGA